MTTIVIDHTLPGGSVDPYGEVEIKLLTGGPYGGAVNGQVISGKYRTTLDAVGYLEVDLEPNEDITPEGTVWRVKVCGDTWYISIPSVGTSYALGDPDIQTFPPPQREQGPEGPPGTVDAASSISLTNIGPPATPTAGARIFSGASGGTDTLYYVTRDGNLETINPSRVVDLTRFGTLDVGAEDWASAPDISSHMAAAAAALNYGDVLTIPNGFYKTDPVTFDTPIAITGHGKFLTRLGPADSATGDALITLENTSSWVQAGHTDGWSINNLTLDGRGRAFDMHGMVWVRGNRSTMHGVRIAHFARSGLVLNDSVRESHFYDLWLRHCGDGQTYPQLDISYTGTADGTNNLFFVMLNTAYPHGDNVWIRPHSDVDSAGGVRSIFFDHCLFHGVTQAPGASLSATDGNAYTSTSDMRNSVQLWAAGASSVWVSHSRFIAAAWGQPAVRVSGFYNDGTVPSGGVQLRMAGIHAGGSSAVLSGTFTVDTGTNIATTADHFLSTGARVTVTTDGTLPAPLAAGIDYFAVVDTSGTFHLAPTWRDAYDDTNTIDLTTTGTGTHTWTVSRHDFHIAEEATAAVFGLANSKLDGTVDNGSIRVDDPSAVTLAIGEGITAGSSQSLLQGGMSQPMGERSAYLRSNSSRASTTTLAAEADMTCHRIRRNAVYQLTAYLEVEGSQNGDFKFGFDVPAGSTIRFTTFGLPTGATGSSAQTNFSITDGDLTSRSIGTLVGGAGVQVLGTVTTGNSDGDLVLHWAQDVSDATATVLRAGSWLRLSRIF